MALKANKAINPYDIDKKLIELGNESRFIPFYAVYGPGGRIVTHNDGPISAGKVVELIEQVKTPAATANIAAPKR